MSLLIAPTCFALDYKPKNLNDPWCLSLWSHESDLYFQATHNTLATWLVSQLVYKVHSLICSIEFVVIEFDSKQAVHH